MSDKMLIRHCSPTLAGLKTANMFTYPYKDEAEMRDGIREWNKRLCKKGLRVIPLRYRDGRGLVYVYRPARLLQDLEHTTAAQILDERGYRCKTPAHCVMRLIQRLDESEEFPHEIGLFLGYPPADVCGFIQKGECKCVGCWKVYTDVASARKTFAKFKKCSDIYAKKHADGRSIEKLTVAS